MTAPTPVLTEKCRYEGKRYGLVYSDTIQNVVSGVTGMCGERGFLCDECKEDRADARAVARMAAAFLEAGSCNLDTSAVSMAMSLLRLAREAGRKP